MWILKNQKFLFIFKGIVLAGMLLYFLISLEGFYFWKRKTLNGTKGFIMINY